MAVTHTTATRDAMCNAVVDRVDAGSVVAEGRLQLAVDSGFTDVVVSIVLQNPAYTAATAGAAALNVGIGLSAVYGGGSTKTVNHFRFIDRDGNEVFRGTVSGPAGNGDVKLANNVVVTGTTLVINSYIYTTIP